jgi:hypothetical protein
VIVGRRRESCDQHNRAAGSRKPGPSADLATMTHR